MRTGCSADYTTGNESPLEKAAEHSEAGASHPSVRHCWHVITSEYPPQSGGVSDYTELVTTELAALGDDVHVWCPAYPGAQMAVKGISIHRQMGSITPSDLRRVSGLLEQFPTPRRLLIQWVPHGYGYRSMNLPFCWWVWKRGRRYGDQVDLMVHEAYLTFKMFGWRQNVAALVHRVMTVMLLRSASRVWISIPAWERRLRPYAMGRPLQYQWLPIFSNVPVVSNAARVQEIRQRHAAGDRILIGHFGTCGVLIVPLLEPILMALAADAAKYTVLLMGHGSEPFRMELVRKEPRLGGMVHATDKLPAEQLSYHLAACDLLMQPYPDGVSTRRTTFMAGLAHGKPVVTTTGELTEPLWSQTDAAAVVPAGDTKGFVSCVQRLSQDADERRRMGGAARNLYQERFDISHVVAALRQAEKSEDSACAS